MEKVIEIPKVITVRQFAQLLNLPVGQVITHLLKNGIRANINESIDIDTATLIADELGYKVKELKVEEKTQEEKVKSIPRPPVVVVMGHVDHGKTKLLDAIRESNLVEKESGGITQHIGAYKVEIKGKKMTFLDTPGHEAFSSLRAHGANITDIVILVVAADEGVKQQTLEAISHARSASVPILVAINKIDKPEANVEMVKKQLAELDLVPEQWGGKTIYVEVSALKKIGIEKLLEMVLLLAEMQDLKAPVALPASGVVIEANMQPNIGPLSTVLVQKGKLQPSQIIVAGPVWGKIRLLFDEYNHKLKEVLPGYPARIIGIKGLPELGDIFQVVLDEKQARKLADENRIKKQVRKIATKTGLGELSKEIAEGKLKELPIIIKADVTGSLEAIKDSLGEMSDQEVKVVIVSEGIGPITEGDIQNAVTSKAIIIGFKVIITPRARKLAENSLVKYHLYDVIYQLLDDIYQALSGLLEPEIVETKIGKFEVIKSFFKIKGKGIIGGKLVSGEIFKDSIGKVIRDEKEIGKIKITTLQKEKLAVSELKAPIECGIGYEGDVKIKPGDIVEIFKMEEVIKKLKKR